MFLFKNNAAGTLLAGITNIATSMTLQAGEGAEFPSPTGVDSFRATLEDSGGLIEIVDVTNVTGDVLTIVRGREGTTGKVYIAGDVVELRVTQETLEAFIQSIDRPVSDKGSNYTMVEADRGSIINMTGAFTVSLPDAGTIPSNFWAVVKNSHSTAITVDLTTGADTLDGVAAGSAIIPPFNAMTFVVNASIDGFHISSTANIPSKDADIASTAALPFQSSGYADVTGTATITSLLTSGKVGTIVRRHFDDILIITHHDTNLILKDRANIITFAGYEAEFIEYASGQWRLLSDNVSAYLGAISAFAQAAAPNGWLECDGAAVSRTLYAALFNSLSTIYGVGNGSTTFNLPDIRGEFIRGFDNGAGIDVGANITDTCSTTISNPIVTALTSTTNMEVGMSIVGSGIPVGALILTVDSATQITMDVNATVTATGVSVTLSNRTDRGDGTIGDVVGSKQIDVFKTHTHTYDKRDTDINTGSGGSSPTSNSQNSTGATGGNETRGRNIQLMHCIKY